jgi:hypothetical protein
MLPQLPNLQQLIEEPVDFENEVRFQLVEKSCVLSDDNQNDHGGDTLILVSAENKIRDEIARIVSKSRKRLEMYELDYVPTAEPICTELSLHGTSEINISRQSIDGTRLSGETIVQRGG